MINNRSFNGSDAQNVGNPVINVPAGAYTLTVSATGDSTSGYQFRLFDLATATSLTPGTVVNGLLNPANSTVAYKFTVSSHGKFIYDFLSSSGLPDAYVRLFDAVGNMPISTGLGSIVGPLVLPAGNYTLLVEGYIGDYGTGSYSFNLNPVTDGSQPLTLGSVVSGAISSPGQHQQYTFALGSAARVYFDSLTNTSNLRWSLDGPTGNVVNTRSFSSSDAQSIGNPVLSLVAGNYTLTVAATTDNTGGYQFRLLDLASAAPLTLGAVVNASLTPANSTVAYQFTLASPTNVLFDYLNSANLPDTYVRLLDNNGNVPLAVGLANVVGPLLLPAGNYTLLVEGYIGDPGSGTYSFNLVPVTDGVQALTLGSLINGAVNSPGQHQQYTFTLASASRLYFDALTNTSSLRWSLDGPTGNIVNSRAFSSSDAQSIGNPILNLPAGAYTLTVLGITDNTGPYQFRLSDLAAATPLTPGTPVSKNNFAANSTDLYRFTAAPGDQVSFIYQSSSGIPNAYWRLIDPFSNILAAQSLASGNSGTNRLTAGGTYTLLIEGYIGDPGLGTYAFNLQPDGNVSSTPFTGAALTIGTPIIGTLPTGTAVTNYVFTLANAARLCFDVLTNANFYWSLSGPQGVVVNNRGFPNSDSADISDSSLALPAGNYQLSITGAAGDYGFELLDFSSATPMTPGVLVSNTLSPADRTVLYQFTGTAGQRLYFNGQPSSGFTYQPYCRLYGPLGNILFFQSVNSDVDTFTLPQSGTYTLTVEGRVYDTHASGNYAFNLLPITYPTNSLTLGATISSTIATRGVRQYYTFTLATASTLYFDALTNADFYWRLDAPWGQVLDWRSFSSSDSADIADPALHLPAGSYVLGIAGNNFVVTGDYQFRLLDFATATAFTPGTAVTNTLAPADSTVFYKFTGTAGQQFYFDGQGASGFTYQPYCRLYAPLGNVIMTQSVNSDFDTFTLPQTGTYTLTVEGRIYDTHASGSYGFNLVPITYPTNSLTVGTTISNTIATPGVRQYYTFTLASASTLYFDALTTSDFYWRLDAPWGQVLDWRSFSSSDSADISDPALHLPAGSYVLAVAGNNFIVTGGYQFRLLDFAGATAFTPGTVVTNTLAPADSTVFYKFNGVAGDHYYFDGQATSGFTYQPYTRLYGPAGNIVMSQGVNNDVDTFALPQSGTYTLTVEGRIFDPQPSGGYSFNLVPNPQAPPVQLFPTNVSPDLIVASPSVSPSTGLQSGGSTTVLWTDQNNGTGPTSGSFTDRVTIRNAANQVLVDSFLPYNESDPGNGPIAPGTTRNRQLAVIFPDGTNSVGTLQVTVTVDAQNAIPESNEANNSTSTSISVALAPYPDLQVSQSTTVPVTRWLPGSVVTINWQLTNSGNGFAATNWTDSVVVRNTNTSAVILSTTTNYNLLDAGNGSIAPGDVRSRSLSFTMPTSSDAYGNFAITITADAANQVFEYNPSGTSELNNTKTITVLSAPDLVPNGLAATSSGPILSGGVLNIAWNDQNTGTVETGSPFYDRVTVVNTNTGQTLMNSTIYYDPAISGNGAIPPGGSRARSTTLQLPDGTAGAGTLLVSVAVDTFGQVPEFNAGGTGEANNTVTTSAISSIANYPDLQVINLGVQPLVLNSGTNLTVQWQDTNSGNGLARSSWYDQVIISNATLGVTLLNTTVLYDTNVLGPLTNGLARNRSVNFTLPNGASGAGTLRVSVIADVFNGVFEYNPAGTAESNNAATSTVVSGIASYPDLQVAGLNVTPSVLGSGTNLTVQWQDTNSGNAIAVGSWYDRLVISNSSLGAILLDTPVYFDQNVLGPLTNGTAVSRSYNFTLPFSSNGAGGLVFSVTADQQNNIFEYNPGGTGENNNTASISRNSLLTPLPDLVISSLLATNHVFTSQLLNAQVRLENQGLLAANGDMVQQIFVSSSPVAGSGTLSAVADFNGVLGVGQFLDQSVALLAPAVPGTYWLIAQADGNNNVLELSENNNSFVSPTPLTVDAAYTATITADIHSALANTPIPMHGRAVLGGSTTPAGSVPITIHIQVRGTDRAFNVFTAPDGTFTNLFQPLPNEAGVYQISAAIPTAANPPAQDSFVLIGMNVAPVSLVDLTEETSITNSTTVNNLSDIPLTGLTVTVVTNQPSLSVSVSLSTNRLDAFGSAKLNFSINALNASVFQSPVILHVASAEGATADLVLVVQVDALRPKLVVNPTSLQGAMQRGTQTPFAFTVSNQGGVPTGPLQVVSPAVPWLSLASSNQLPPLPPGFNTVVTILLTPASDLPLGDYNGNLVVQSTNAATQVTYSFRAVSGAKGNMLVKVEDEYTYFASGSPPVTNAQVVVSDALTGTAVATNLSGADGTASFTNLTEAYYTVDVSADTHGPFRQSALVAAGNTTNVTAFLPRQTVTYSFTVTPTTVPDQYTFQIDSTFETQVPIPVVTIEPASLDLSQYPGNQFQVLYTIANHGLIDAESVTLQFPTASWVQMTALVTNLGKLKANSSYTVPVLVTRLNQASPQISGSLGSRTATPLDAGSGTCSVTAQMLWNYLCGPNVVDKSTAYYAFDSTGCNLVDLYKQVYHLAPDNPGTGTGGITSQQYFDYLGQLGIVTDFEPPPGYHFACNASPPAASVRPRPFDSGNSVCAKVSIRLDQKGVLTRDAFNATLEINNDVTDPLQNVSANIQITDLNGNIVTTNFAVAAPSLSGLTAVDGTGTLPGSTTGTATWTLIPTLDAAPSSDMTIYLVGGTLSYSQSGTVVSVPLAAAPIQVFPQPELVVRYFHDRNVFADDPFTPQIEPSIPYSLAVQVNNVGHGPAHSLSISSGKPQIVDNVKGLLINFNILGTQVENQPATPALTADFGSIDPATNKIARWLFTSSLQGSFTNFSASFSQVDQFGKPRLSLVRSVEIHELTHIVDADGTFEDGRADFLVNDVSDPDFLPDALYLSDGSVVAVSAVTNAVVTGALNGTNLTINVSATLPGGWSYLQFGDPGPGLFKLAHVFRPNNSEVPFGTNVWTTDRNFIGGATVPVHTNLVHLLDYNSAGTYRLVYAPVVTNSVDTNPPTSLVAALPASTQPSFTVQWAGTDNQGGSGIAFFNIYVSVNGGPFTAWITNTALAAAIYNGAPNNTYAFFSRATDLAGNQEPAHLVADAQTTTTAPSNSPPVITFIPTQTLTEGGLFSFTPTATDSQPGVALTWSLLPGAPPGALIAPQTGHLTWQTSVGDGGTTNRFAVVVADNGSPSLSATQAFNVVVTRINHAPSMTALTSPVSLTTGSTLSLQLTATDPDLPLQTLSWHLSANSPSGLSLDAATGLLTWTPTQAQAPSTNVVTATVTDNGTPPLSDSQTFAIVVIATNHPPALAPIGSQTAYVLLPLSFTNIATDSDLPKQTLTFSLDPGAPSGASINPTNGVFSWTPTRAQARSTNTITVRVTDSGYPTLSGTRSFTVTVGDYLELLMGSTIFRPGETGAVSVVMNSTTPVTNLNFNLTLGARGLTNLSLANPGPPVGLATLKQISLGQYQASLASVPGQTLTATQTVATLNFQAQPVSASTIVSLQLSGLSANQPNGTPLFDVLSDDGQAVLINNTPLLDAKTDGSQLQLTLFAPPGPSYTVQTSLSLSPQIWSPLFTTPVGASLFQSFNLPFTNSHSFFRVAVP
ncbi:MAG TPA: CARDB domain-containing protein [Verrucomicrobiae bacterium]|nr:CARDB domain-containing protein [Verrucomicrobiae bacterium]